MRSMVGEENGKINKQVGGFYQYIISSSSLAQLTVLKKINHK